jgi:hypothetical protein
MTSQREDTTARPARHAGGALIGSLGHPLLPAVIATAAYAALVVARWATWAKHNIGNFILVGRHFANAAQLPAGIPVQPTYGYDGQFYYRLALNPANLAHTAYGITMDHSYRFMRIGYPAVAWLVSFGQHSLVPAALIAVNVVSVGALGYFGGVLARQGGRHVLWGLLMAAYFGLITSVSRDTAEPLAAAFLLAALVALRARRPLSAALLLACGTLTRETVMVAVAAVGVVRVVTMVRTRQLPGRDDLPWVLPTLVFAAWQLVIYAVTGSVAIATDGGRNAGAPFTAPLHALVFNLRHITGQFENQYNVWLLEFFVLALCCVAATAVLRASRAPAWEKLAFYLYIVEICVVSPSTWGSLDGDMRSFIEVYMFAVVVLLGVPAGRFGARYGWVLPVLAVWVIAAGTAVVQRRLTISFRAPLPVRAPRSAARARAVPVHPLPGLPAPGPRDQRYARQRLDRQITLRDDDRGQRRVEQRRNLVEIAAGRRAPPDRSDRAEQHVPAPQPLDSKARLLR